MASEDTEITLGVGKLLGLFILLAAICANLLLHRLLAGEEFGPRTGVNDQPTTTTVSRRYQALPTSAITSQPPPLPPELKLSLPRRPRWGSIQQDQ